MAESGCAGEPPRIPWLSAPSKQDLASAAAWERKTPEDCVGNGQGFGRRNRARARSILFRAFPSHPRESRTRAGGARERVNDEQAAHRMQARRARRRPGQLAAPAHAVGHECGERQPVTDGTPLAVLPTLLGRRAGKRGRELSSPHTTTPAPTQTPSGPVHAPALPRGPPLSPPLLTAMSFLSRRRRAQAPLQDSGNLAAPAAGSIYSVDKPPSVLRRHINFSSPLHKLTAKLSARSRHSNLAHAPIGNVGVPSGRWRSRSPSPAPSLDIRMPADLGRRASELGEREDIEEPSSVPGRRKRSISLPAAVQAARWRDAMAREEQEASATPSQTTSALSRASPELLATIFSYARRRDLFALAQASKTLSPPALRALYENLDLRAAGDERAARCIASLASHRHIATLVRSFACRTLPSTDDAAQLTTVTYAIAFNNMDGLRALTLPRFDLRILSHTTFTLQRLVLLCKNMPTPEFHALVAWLARQPELTALSLPRLVLPALPPPCEVSPLPHTPPTPDTPTHDIHDTTPNLLTSPSPPSPSPSSASSSACTDPIPTSTLPKLRRIQGPVSLAAALALQRPLERADLPIQNTLYDGLRPSAIMGALATARNTLRTLSIQPVSAAIDSRTLERVLMAAGAELGSFLEELEVHWVLDDEGLYKLILPVLGRFRALRTLRLLRDSPPPNPPSPLLEFPLPPASPPLTPGSRASISSFSSVFPQFSSSSLRRLTTGAGAETPFPRVHERAHLALWCKTCASLERVWFLSGAEWAVLPRSAEEAAFGLPPFEFVGYMQA
ncbi:hypothetical protein C2E23DRAFT_929915 [Lenzites betulinus]|nr:hypothetical protein C2E23DRAFT_929915 [Lenzites betulinus]